MTDGKHPVTIWDLPVRLFHWTLVVLLGFSWWSAEQGGLWMQYHQWSGYGILTLVTFRLVWGVIGSTHARFADFIRGPRAVLGYLRHLFDRRGGDAWAGHNPLGGWVVLVMLALLLVQVGTGLFATDDILFEGPLNGLVSDDTASTLTGIHYLNFNILLAVIVVHVCAALFYLVYKRENLITAMITGRKRLSAAVAAQPRRTTALGWALLVVVVCGGLVAGILGL